MQNNNMKSFMRRAFPVLTELIDDSDQFESPRDTEWSTTVTVVIDGIGIDVRCYLREADSYRNHRFTVHEIGTIEYDVVIEDTLVVESGTFICVTQTMEDIAIDRANEMYDEDMREALEYEREFPNTRIT